MECWEDIDSGGTTSRMRVHGGWLVHCWDNEKGKVTALTFVPDPRHDWDIGTGRKAVNRKLLDEASKYVHREIGENGVSHYWVGGARYVEATYHDQKPLREPVTVEEAVNLAMCMVQAESDGVPF